MSEEAWGSPVVALVQTVSPSSIASAEAFGTPTIGSGVQVLSSIESEESFGVPMVLTDEDEERAIFVDGERFAPWESSLKIERTLNTRDRGTLVYLRRDGLPVYGRDVEVLMVVDGDRKFGGFVESSLEEAIDAHDDKSRVTLNLAGFGAYFDRFVVAELYDVRHGPVSVLASIILYDIWYKHLRQFGVTFDYPNNQVNIDIGVILFHYIKGQEAINQIKARTPGYDIWIDEHKALQFKSTTGVSPNAPFSISDGSNNWDFLSVLKSQGRKRNVQYVLPSKDLASFWTELYTADGVQVVFNTQFQQVFKPRVFVDTGGGPVEQIVAASGEWLAGWQFAYVPGGVGLLAATAPAAGAIVTIQYPSPFQLAAKAVDQPSIDAVGVFEEVYHAKDVTDWPTTEAIAEGLLERNVEDYEEVHLKWNNGANDAGVARNPEWLKPGMVVSIEKNYPELTGNYTVEAVSSFEQAVTLWRHEATLRKGMNAVMEEARMVEMLTASRMATVSPPLRLTIALGMDNPPDENPGIELGLLTDFDVVPRHMGGISFRDWEFQSDDPPLGADLIVDVLIDGVSIFEAGQLPTIPAGSTSLQRGFRFEDIDARYYGGEKVTVNVTQIGSTFAGRRAKLFLNARV